MTKAGVRYSPSLMLMLQSSTGLVCRRLQWPLWLWIDYQLETEHSTDMMYMQYSWILWILMVSLYVCVLQKHGVGSTFQRHWWHAARPDSRTWWDVEAARLTEFSSQSTDRASVCRSSVSWCEPQLFTELRSRTHSALNLQQVPAPRRANALSRTSACRLIVDCVDFDVLLLSYR